MSQNIISPVRQRRIRLQSANESSSTAAALSNITTSLNTTPTPSTSSKGGANWFSVGQNGNTLKNYEELVKAIQGGKVKSIRCVLKPYDHVASYRADYELTTGEKGEIKLVLPEDIKDLKSVCREYNISWEEDTPGPTDWVKDFGKEALVQLVAPLGFMTAGWFGAKYFKLYKYKGQINELSKDLLADIQSKKQFSLNETSKHIVGVDILAEFSKDVQEHIDHFKKTGERGTPGVATVGGTIGGAAGSGKTTVAYNAVKALLDADSEAQAYQLREQSSIVGMLGVGVLTVKDRAKAYVENAKKNGVKRMILVSDDPEAENENGRIAVYSNLQLMKAIVDMAARDGIVTNCFMITNELEAIRSGNNRHKVEALTRRIGKIYAIDSFSPKEIEEQFNYFASQNGLNDTTLAKTFSNLQFKINGTIYSAGNCLTPAIVEELAKAMVKSGKSPTDLNNELSNPASETVKRLQNIVAGRTGISGNP